MNNKSGGPAYPAERGARKETVEIAAEYADLMLAEDATHELEI